MTTPQNTHPASRPRFRAGLPLMVVVVFGLLLWAKLLLVTNHPRTAIAEPEPSAALSAAPAPADPR